MTNTLSLAFLQPSTMPTDVIKALSYPGQDPLRRMYKTGYEQYLSMLPILDQEDPLLDAKVEHSRHVMQSLHDELATQQWVFNDFIPMPKELNRTIIAIEQPDVLPDGTLQSKTELVVTRWGDGFYGAPHGHTEGFMYEQVLGGMIRGTVYRLVDEQNGIVRPIRTKVYGPGDRINEEYFISHPTRPFAAVIHSLTSIGFSSILHYVSSHPTDGKRHMYTPQYFDDVWEYKNEDLTRINSFKGMYLRKGDVILVRSSNVPEYGDHYMIVTGAPIMKRHGLRPQEFSIEAPRNKVLDKYEMENGLILLKLNEDARKAFYEFYDIHL